jgi:hypothetical protein
MLLIDSATGNSPTNVFHGSYNSMQNYPGHDIAVGGKSRMSGYESYRDVDQAIKHLLILGWLASEVDIGKKENRELAPTNHASLIFNLLTGEIEIGLTEREGTDIYNAVQLWMAVAQSKEGLEYYLKVMEPNR